MKQKTLTLKQLYKVGTVKLAEEGIEEFSLDAWYLLEYVTGVSKAMYFAEPERAVSEENADRYIDCIRDGAQRIFHCNILQVSRIHGLSVLCE